MKLRPRQIASIHAFQRAEIERLVSDREFAIACSRMPQYSRIGHWLPLNQRGRVLELGCGPGRYVAMLASMGHDVVGVDPYSYDTWSLIQQHRRVELEKGVFAESLPFPTASFDHVACMGALLYFKNAVDAMSEVRRVLRPSGRLIVRNINRNNLFRLMRRRNIDPATTNAYSATELVQFLTSCGFSVNEHFTHGFYSPIFSMQYWYLLNGILSDRVQQVMSDWTPESLRTTVTAFAVRVP